MITPVDGSAAVSLTCVYRRFPTTVACLEQLEHIRWGDTPTCPYCGSPRSTLLPRELRRHCNGCNTTYSATVNTVFHRTHLPLQKWFFAVWLIVTSRSPVTTWGLARALGVNKNTAWLVSSRVRAALLTTEGRRLLQSVAELGSLAGQHRDDHRR